jgi:hypothetical protein
VTLPTHLVGQLQSTKQIKIVPLYFINMENLLVRQSAIIDAISSLRTNFGKDSATRKTPDYIERRLSTLRPR